MGEYALYCGLGDRVAVLTYTKQEGKKHLLLEKDLAAYGTSGKSRTRRRRITPEEQKSCRARIESWLVAEGYRFESETLFSRILCTGRRNDLMTQNAGAAFGSARGVLCAPGERTFYRVKVPSPPGSGKG